MAEGGSSTEVTLMRQFFPITDTVRRYSCSPVLRIIRFLFARHEGMNIIIWSILAMGVCLLVIRLECYDTSCLEFQQLLYFMIWLFILSVSLVCCRIYYRMIHSFPFDLLYGWYQSESFHFIYLSIPTVLAVCGIVSTYAISILLMNVYYKVSEMAFSHLWIMFLYVAAGLRGTEQFCEAIFITLVFPVTLRWADLLDNTQRDLILQLFPCKMFLYPHSIILFATFYHKPILHIFNFTVSDLFHVIGFMFWAGFMIWEFALLLYVGCKELESKDRNKQKKKKRRSSKPNIDFHTLADRKPTLHELMCFTTEKGKKKDILQCIGTYYVKFGVLLLEDHDGARINGFASKNMNKPYETNKEIIQEWLQGNGKYPISWRTLVNVLRDTNLRELAQDIEGALHP